MLAHRGVIDQLDVAELSSGTVPPDESVPPDGPAADDADFGPPVRSLYVRALRLRHIEPVGWRRVIVAEGSLVLGLFLALADVASAWAIAAVPLASAAVVKYHDVLAGLLEPDIALGGDEVASAEVARRPAGDSPAPS